MYSTLLLLHLFVICYTKGYWAMLYIELNIQFRQLVITENTESKNELICLHIHLRQVTNAADCEGQQCYQD